MSDVPENLKYTKTHEWVKEMEGGTLMVGITDHAQELLGDLVFVELPETGRTMAAGDQCAVIESVKAASDIYSPVAGRITAVNEYLSESPEQINQQPYEDGWIMRLQPDDHSELDGLLDAAAYREFAESEEH